MWCTLPVFIVYIWLYVWYLRLASCIAFNTIAVFSVRYSNVVFFELNINVNWNPCLPRHCTTLPRAMRVLFSQSSVHCNFVSVKAIQFVLSRHQRRTFSSFTHQLGISNDIFIFCFQPNQSQNPNIISKNRPVSIFYFSWKSLLFKSKFNYTQIPQPNRCLNDNEKQASSIQLKRFTRAQTHPPMWNHSWIRVQKRSLILVVWMMRLLYFLLA